jgi:hypothetical protein
MSKNTENYESVVAAWARVGEAHDLDYQVFAPPPAKSRLGRFGQRASGKSAGIWLGGSRVGHVLSGTIGNVDVAVLAGNDNAIAAADVMIECAAIVESEK